MFKNHFTLAWRSLVKGKVYAAINILGLAVGISTCLIILLYVSKELSYDKFHEKADRIYRVSLSFRGPQEWTNIAWAPGPLAGAIKSSIPEAEVVAELASPDAETIVEHRNNRVYESGFVYATPSLFEIFDFPLVSGEAIRSLSEPYNVLLSESMAAKYFPGEDPLGKALKVDNAQVYKIAGVFKDIPDNSHIRFDFVASRESQYALGLPRDNWHGGGSQTYVLLNKQASPDEFQQKLEKLRDEAMAAPFHLEKGKEPGVNILVTPLANIHLYGNFSSEQVPQGNIMHVYIFSAIGLLILVIACINYTNLGTALGIMRAKEVGVRKIHGAQRTALIWQYLSESFFFVGISLLAALLLGQLFLPRVNEIMDRSLAISLSDPRLYLMFGGLWIVVGLGAGLYPAFFLSGFGAGRSLKGHQQIQSRGFVRKALITFQLTVSITLIACTIVIQSQMELVRDSRPGFHQEQVVFIPTRRELSQEFNGLREKLRHEPSISSMTTCSFYPGEPGMISFVEPKEIEGLEGRDVIVVDGIIAGFGFEKVFELKILQGRSFDESLKTDLDGAILVNAAAVRKFGWDEALGKTIQFGGKVRRVVGVVEDFHYKSLRDEIAPLIITPTDVASTFIAVRLNGGHIADGIQRAESAWKELVPQLPFSFTFLDDSFNALYTTEMRFNTLVTAFSLLAILVACMGLLGLSAFTAQLRTKEMGIRKTLGASVGNIVSLLTADYIKWVALGLVMAVPLAHYVMGKWLETFQYKVTLGPWIYASAGFIALLLVVVATGWKSVQTALKNPVDVLKHD